MGVRGNLNRKVNGTAGKGRTMGGEGSGRGGLVT